jgi:hypothetical protein
LTPRDLLAAARDVLDSQDTGATGAWPRAVAVLTRQALELEIGRVWVGDQRTAGLHDCTMKTQLLCLPTYLEPRLAREISYVWAVLSNACHYHPYDLAPTAAELGGWMSAVARLVNEVDGKPSVLSRERCN